jgi:5'-methylthioinosine phosphorylase
LLAIIGGSGLSKLDILQEPESKAVATPYSETDVIILIGRIANQAVAFLPRHGSAHILPPHRINYRANIWALREIGVTDIVSINAVGGINPQMAPGLLAIPDQIIDYTYDRAHTFHDEHLTEVIHIDFTNPFSKKLRHMLILAVEEDEEDAVDTQEGLPITEGVYGCTQGPRLESAAEVAKLKRDGCDMVGMTGMPEAALARELGLEYASLALSVNRAAGLDDKPITMAAINKTLVVGIKEIKRLLPIFIDLYSAGEKSPS